MKRFYLPCLVFGICAALAAVGCQKEGPEGSSRPLPMREY